MKHYCTLEDFIKYSQCISTSISSTLNNGILSQLRIVSSTVPELYFAFCIIDNDYIIWNYDHKSIVSTDLVKNVTPEELFQYSTTMNQGTIEGIKIIKHLNYSGNNNV